MSNLLNKLLFLGAAEALGCQFELIGWCDWLGEIKALHLGTLLWEADAHSTVAHRYSACRCSNRYSNNIGEGWCASITYKHLPEGATANNRWRCVNVKMRKLLLWMQVLPAAKTVQRIPVMKEPCLLTVFCKHFDVFLVLDTWNLIVLQFVLFVSNIVVEVDS